MSCMCGTITDGRCSHCGRPPIPAEKRRANALPLGLKLHGRYWLGNVLGRGGFGITYAAWDMIANQRVAVKELYPSMDVSRGSDSCTVQILDGQEEYFSQVYHCFEKEARTLMELQDDGVVRLYHVFTDNNTIYYVMEYLDGQDMAGVLKQNGPMSWSALAPILKTVLNALNSLHERGMIHRDISPDNIFITLEGRARLIDFGSVRTYQGTRSFTSFVKPNFAPYEQYKAHGKQGPWTDVYALSVTAYYALTGQLPPSAPDRKLNDNAVPVGRLCPQLPSHVAAGIQKGMCVSIEGRCQSARELSDLLFPGENVITDSRVLYSCAGAMSGQSWRLRPGTRLTIGRQGCSILYPSERREVSRTQCTICMDGSGRVMVRDEGSRNGTYCGGVRLQPGTWYQLQPGHVVTFANNHEQYRIQ